LVARSGVDATRGGDKGATTDDARTVSRVTIPRERSVSCTLRSVRVTSRSFGSSMPENWASQPER